MFYLFISWMDKNRCHVNRWKDHTVGAQWTGTSINHLLKMTIRFFLMTPKPFNCSILCVIYNFMDFHNSCGSAARNKNFEWTAFSGISTIIGSYKDVHLLLSVWLILRKHRAKRAKSFCTSSFGTLSRANSLHGQRRARTEFLWFLVPCMLSRKQSP